jgi:hypothetical protein
MLQFPLGSCITGVLPGQVCGLEATATECDTELLRATECTCETSTGLQCTYVLVSGEVHTEVQIQSLHGSNLLHAL